MRTFSTSHKLARLLIAGVVIATTLGTVRLWQLTSQPISSIRGVLRDPVGSALARYDVTLLRLIGNPTRIHHFVTERRVVETDEGGQFEFENLPPGNYRIIAQSGARATLRLARGERLRHDLDTDYGPYFPKSAAGPAP